MGFNFTVPVRLAQVLLAIITLGVDASLVVELKGFKFDDYDLRFASDTPGNYVLFVAVWTILFASYLALAALFFEDSAAAHPVFVVVLDFFSWVFWLAAWADFARIVSIWDKVPDFPPDGRFEAVLALSLAVWVCFCVTLVYSIVVAFRGGRGKYSSAAV